LPRLRQFGVLSAENFPLELRTTGISIVNCSNRMGAICAQFVNGFLIGPPPHVEALLLVVSSVMMIGGCTSQHLSEPGGARSDTSESAEVSERDLSHQQRAKGREGPSSEIEMKTLEEDDLRRDLEAEELETSAIDAPTGSDEAKVCLRRSERSLS
jgi:hypothetical protein